MKKKNNRTLIVLMILIFLAGLSLLLYPAVSNFVNSRSQARAIATYLEEVDDLDAETCARMISLAKKHNESLLERDNDFSLNPQQQQQYDSLLNLTGSGIMGYVEIPCIDCTIPVYHSTEEDVLQHAAGHVDWSSLPVGGPDTHCVISGHRGLPSAELLTHIDRLRVGDRFYINVLGERLEYQVDQIKVVLPADASDLTIVPDGDYVTMVTCTPYGINSHRLLVRGVRIIDGRPVNGQIILTNEAEAVSMIYVLPVGLAVLAVGVFVFLGIGKLLKRRPKEKKDETTEETSS